MNGITQLTDTGKQVLKVVSSINPDITFGEGQVALSINRSPATARQYLRQLERLGWVKRVGREFKNNVEENLTRKIEEVQKPGQEKIPEAVIERCKRELLTFIQSL